MSSYFEIPRLWENQTALIVGGGPSACLVRHHLPAIYQKFKTIAVNDSVFLLPQADVLYFRDLKWWKEPTALPRGEWVRKHFRGEYLLTSENEIFGVARLRETGATGLETDPSGIRHGSNSGYQAINVAFHFGVRRIVLIGFDMRVVNERAHWNYDHCGTSNAADYTTIFRDVMLPKFSTLEKPLAEAGVEVINASPDSALTMWPHRSLEQLLEEA